MVEEIKMNEKDNTNEEVIDQDIDSLETREPKKQFNPDLYQGEKIKLLKPQIKEVIDWYTGEETGDGKRAYNPDSKEKKKVVEIQTENLQELDKDGTKTGKDLKFGENFISVKQQFNLKKELNIETEKEEWVISKHPKAALWKFMRKMGVEKLSELEGKIVIITTVPSNNEDDDRKYLKIVI